MLVDTVRTIWLSVPTFTGAFPNVTQLLLLGEALDCSRYGLLINGHVKNNELGGEWLRFNGGYLSVTETLSNRMALVALIPFVALIP